MPAGVLATQTLWHGGLQRGRAYICAPTACLATKILSVEKDLPIPVPIEELSHQLDVGKIASLTTIGFEGGLLTDEDRSTGIILVNQAAPGGAPVHHRP
ncbi:hypothetical protein [Bradyrhizobium sp. 160]|uniref:hypothetical protein n=1 Tax=Bradyrhizobium sp. 160 TaxID=2782634 RepID=UPI001FFB8E3B|nr:hypothetical protein [Bradyrhizobium sp. 160]